MKYILLILTLFNLCSCTSNAIECEDLLQKYDEKPQKLEFLECKKDVGQTILIAKYKVLGVNADEIEKILIKKYGIGKLEFTCCGWESVDGKNGYIENEMLKKINKNYVLEVSMLGNAEMEDEEGNTYLELEKSKAEFYVIVKLLEV